MSSTRPQSLIADLGLITHPEGGYYREVHRSAALVKPADGRDQRAALTTIFFLLLQGQVSRWHRVLSEEVWHFYEGAPLELWMMPAPDAPIQRFRVGPVQSDQQPVAVVPGGWWQAARSLGDYTLTGCSVGPGFDFRDFSLAADHPATAAAIGARGGDSAALL
jgi:uncharacterized protein